MVYFGLTNFVFVSNYLSYQIIYHVLMTVKGLEESMEKPELLNPVSFEIKVIFFMDVVTI